MLFHAYKPLRTTSPVKVVLWSTQGTFGPEPEGGEVIWVIGFIWDLWVIEVIWVIWGIGVIRAMEVIGVMWMILVIWLFVL